MDWPKATRGGLRIVLVFILGTLLSVLSFWTLLLLFGLGFWALLLAISLRSRLFVPNDVENAGALACSSSDLRRHRVVGTEVRFCVLCQVRILRE